MKARNTALLLLLLLIACSLSAQVTVGSNNAPVSGALLQLKESEGTDENAAKGLVMPRVVLSDLTPATDAALAKSIGGSGSYSMSEHIGLVVYNIGSQVVDDPCSMTLSISPGLYVWHGDKWEALYGQSGSGSGSTGGGVKAYTDQEGEEFFAYTFGEAGTWMVHNLAVTKYSDGTPLEIHDESSTNPPLKAMYAYPAADGADKWKTKPAGWTRKQGILYNWRAASGNYSPASKDQKQSTLKGATPGADEVEKDATLAIQDSKGNYVVQGICPQGWHLPSDREWNELEREIYNNAQLYSYYTQEERDSFVPSQWQDEWDTTSDYWGLYRGSTSGKGHGAAMIGKCLMPDVQVQNSYEGVSKPAPLGGFDVVLTGYVRDRNASTYGKMEQNWTSSIYYNDNAYVRIFGDPDSGNTTNYIGVRRHPTDRCYLHPVRCKKND